MMMPLSAIYFHFTCQPYAAIELPDIFSLIFGFRRFTASFDIIAGFRCRRQARRAAPR